jgi:hypothetical protein
MKLPKPTLKKLKADNPDAPKYELVKNLCPLEDQIR